MAHDADAYHAEAVEKLKSAHIHRFGKPIAGDRLAALAAGSASAIEDLAKEWEEIAGLSGPEKLVRLREEAKRQAIRAMGVEQGVKMASAIDELDMDGLEEFIAEKGEEANRKFGITETTGAQRQTVPQKERADSSSDKEKSSRRESLIWSLPRSNSSPARVREQEMFYKALRKQAADWMKSSWKPTTEEAKVALLLFAERAGNGVLLSHATLTQLWPRLFP